MNTIASFNLIDEPWIEVRTSDGFNDAVSIRTALLNSNEIRCITGELGTQAFAIARILVAIVRRAIEWGASPEERWETLYRTGVFATEDINPYLDRHLDRFDLLDPVRPFFQVADLTTGKGEHKPIEIIVSDVPSGNSAKYFSMRGGAGIEMLSFAEAARWLVHVQGFDVSGIKSGDPRDPRTKGGKGYPIGTGWLGQLGGLYMEGRSLFETIMLNCVVDGHSDVMPRSDDFPLWERAVQGCGVRDDPSPSGPNDLLTWQSRRVRLIVKGGAIGGALVANGDPLESHNRDDVELFSPWRFSPQQTKKHGGDRWYLPRKWNPDRTMWQGMEGILAGSQAAGERYRPAGVVTWLAHLRSEEILPDRLMLRTHCVGMEYGTKDSSIAECIDDVVTMSIAVLADSVLGSWALDAARDANDSVRALVELARRLTLAAGGGSLNYPGLQAEAYSALELPFRLWLVQLGTETDDDPLALWQRITARIVSRLRDDLIGAAPEAAWIGRQVDNQWLDVARADAIFRGTLRAMLPAAFSTTMATEE